MQFFSLITTIGLKTVLNPYLHEIHARDWFQKCSFLFVVFSFLLTVLRAHTHACDILFRKHNNHLLDITLEKYSVPTCHFCRIVDSTNLVGHVLYGNKQLCESTRNSHVSVFPLRCGNYSRLRIEQNKAFDSIVFKGRRKIANRPRHFCLFWIASSKPHISRVAFFLLHAP